MNAKQTVAAFGSDVKLADYAGWEGEYASDEDENPNHITINFISVQAADGIKANHPYMIKTSWNVAEFGVEIVVVSPSNVSSITTGSARKGTLGNFIGNYVAGFTVPKHTLFLATGSSGTQLTRPRVIAPTSICLECCNHIMMTPQRKRFLSYPMVRLE